MVVAHPVMELCEEGTRLTLFWGACCSKIMICNSLYQVSLLQYS